MTRYFRDAVRDQAARGEGLLFALGAADLDGDRFSEDEVVANAIITLVGGLETTTNLIGNGLFTLLQHPAPMDASAGRPRACFRRRSRSCSASRVPFNTRRASPPTTPSLAAD